MISHPIKSEPTLYQRMEKYLPALGGIVASLALITLGQLGVFGDVNGVTFIGCTFMGISLSAAYTFSTGEKWENALKIFVALVAAQFFITTPLMLDVGMIAKFALFAGAGLALSHVLHERIRDQETRQIYDTTFFMGLGLGLSFAALSYFGGQYLHFSQANAIFLGCLGGALFACAAAHSYEKTKHLNNNLIPSS